MTKLKTEVRLASVNEIQSLRHAVLWPHKSFENCILESDTAQDTFHVGCFYQNQCIGTSTWQMEPTPKWSCDDSYRLRAMAVHLDFRRRGIGEELIRLGLQKCKEKKVAGVWCDARMGALEFYRELNFQEMGEPYFVPQIGWHKFMCLKLI
jgi:predicted N-acetyltransferase YhbS